MKGTPKKCGFQLCVLPVALEQLQIFPYPIQKSSQLGLQPDLLLHAVHKSVSMAAKSSTQSVATSGICYISQKQFAKHWLSLIRDHNKC